MKHILIVDDDIYIGNMLEEVLTKEGYKVSRTYSGTETVMLLSIEKPDLVLLDLMLPGLSGEEVLSKIKGIPVIVISAKVDIDNKVELLLSGATDYITKPFNTKELLARITVALRTVHNSLLATTLSFDNLHLDTMAHIVTVDQQEVNHISTDTPDCTESSLKIHISNLRKKLRDVGGKDYIEAIWGIGFKLTAR